MALMSLRCDDDLLPQLGIVHAWVTAFHVAGEVLADEVVEQRPSTYCLKSHPSTVPRTFLAICQMRRFNSSLC